MLQGQTLCLPGGNEFRPYKTTNDNTLNKKEKFNSAENENKNNDTNDIPMFEIFGIKLYLDDILLICLIFFLYDEGVKDQSLFIALILLLLS